MGSGAGIPVILPSLLATRYSLLATHYSLLTTHYSLLTTHYSFLTPHSSFRLAEEISSIFRTF
ncbi:hypothetical protein FJV82_25390 [Mesorhizobium sp. WSM4305]|nr:hypothetical protein FJV82_25390 [Mesorhizobium sp. WSM4305]